MENKNKETKMQEKKLTEYKEEKQIEKAEKEIDKEKSKQEENKTPDKSKKTQAIVNGRNLSISTKHAIAVCNYIRNKDVDKAILMLEEIEKMKKPLPMKGEIPHRKGRIMSGRYPIKAAGEFIRLLKSLKSNAIVNELELEKYVIFCKANIAARPYRRFGRTRFKRTHVTLKLIENIKQKKTKKLRK